MPKRKLPSITECRKFKGKYVFLRGSLNVPVKDGQVVNQFRLMRGLATINYLVREEARVILAGHISASEKTEKEESLMPVYDILKTHLPITFSDEVATPTTIEKRDALEDGEVLLIENLRQDPREKKNDSDFARSLADLADIYVTDAFAAAHREHASIVGVPNFLPSYVGLNFRHEYEELKKAMKPKSLSLFMIGGAKFGTKIPLIKKYVEIYDHVFVGGALANDFFKAKGLEVGTSLTSDVDTVSLRSLLKNKKILLPIDVTVVGKNGVRTVTPDNVEPHEKILDAGPETVGMLQNHIKKAKTILWNGPFGDYEHGFDKQTVATAKHIADAEAYSVIGGGDTIAAIEVLNCQEKYGFLSTAGGAMLTFLEHGTLPAIEAVLKSKR